MGSFPRISLKKKSHPTKRQSNINEYCHRLIHRDLPSSRVDSTRIIPCDIKKNHDY